MARRRPLVRAAGKNQQIPVGDALVLAGALDEAPIVTLASAATVAIGAAQANTLNISGTTTITAFDTITAGARRTLRFLDALTLTYDSIKLILPRSSSITTLAGDTADFVSLGDGNWACIGYQRATAAGSKADSGLEQVDNTSDINKPISTATQTALNSKANSANPSTTGTFTHGGGSIVHNPVTQANASMELGYTGGGATTPYQDWHSGATAVDYDVRTIISGGDGTVGNGLWRTLSGGNSFGGTGTRSARLELSGSNLTGVTQYGALMNASFSPAVATNAVISYTAGPQIQDASGTIGEVTNYRATSPAFAGTSAQVTLLHHFYAFDATSNYVATAMAYRGSMNTLSGTTRWNLYMNGSAPSHINSDLRIGTTSQKNTDKLTVVGAMSCTLPAFIGTYTLSTLPSASSYSGYLIQVSNASRGWALCRSNGTSWIDLYTQAAVA